MFDIISIIFKREKKYYSNNWERLTTLIVVLSVLLGLLLFIPLNDINNFNNSMPYHIQIENVPNKVLDELNNLENIDKIGSRVNLITEKNTNSSIEYYDKNAMKFNSVELIKGRMPLKVNEIISTNNKNELGEKISAKWYNKDNNIENINFVVVGIAKNQLISEKNNNIFIVSNTFLEKYFPKIKGKEIYLTLKDSSDSEISNLKEKIEKQGIQEKAIHINTFYLDGIFGNKSQLLVMILFLIMIVFLSKAILSAIYTIFIEGDKSYFYKLRILGLDTTQLKKLINKRLIYLLKILIVTLFILLFIIRVIYYLLGVKFSIYIYMGVCVYVFLALGIAIKLVLNKQIKEVENDESYLSRYGYDLSKVKIKKHFAYINSKLLAKRNKQIYKKRYSSVLRSLSIIILIFVSISTAFNSINMEERLKQIFHYNESFIIFPKMNDQYAEIKGFQEDSPFTNKFINSIKKIKGIDEIRYNYRISAEIKNKEGETLKEIFDIIDNKAKETLKQDLVSGDITKDGIILNSGKLSEEGVSCDIGDTVMLMDDYGNKVNLPVIAIVNNKNSREELYITQKSISKLNSGNNYIYSISIICKNKNFYDSVKNDLRMLVNKYSDLDIRDYNVQLENLNSTFRNIYFTIGGVLIILLLIFISSFINIERVNLIQRKREFALLEINGMSENSILKSVLYEGFSYIKKIVIIIPVLSIIVSYFFVYLLKEFMNLSFLKFKYSLISLLLVIIILLLTVFLVSYKELKHQNNENIIKRVRL